MWRKEENGSNQPGKRKLAQTVALVAQLFLLRLSVIVSRFCNCQTFISAAVLPLRHDLVGIWKIAVGVLHLERIGIADLVICSAVVGAFDHYDITSWTPQINGVTLTRQLPPY